MKRTGAVMFMFLLLSFGPLFAICSSPGYILKEANYIPRNYQEYLEMNKHIQCKSSAQKIVYLLDSIKEKTLIGCFHEDFIYGKYCPEYNSDNCEHDTGSNAEGACGVAVRTVSTVLNQSTILSVSQESVTFPLLMTGNTSATEECHVDAAVIVPPVSNTGPLMSGPPVSREFDTSTLPTTSIVMHTNQNEDPSVTEERLIVDAAITVPPVSNTGPLMSGPPVSQEFDTSTLPTTSIVKHTNQNEDPSVTEVATGTVPPVSNTGGPGSQGSKTSPLCTTGNNNSFVMHTKQEEDPPVTEEGNVEVEIRETIDLPEHPDEQENTGMDVILNFD
ncbi:uncharacterized protein LOC128185562 isoform X2 [Crassostrea angulata]|uniref:uncharacterized protein LOC128185562 isoform X2 n=1 Tax=Magallana angulata TaxID=2784310 RepID=UPI0022B1B1E1|nr:uncharacterized protein LOC128185562 isoform X2 [Crassostrea angulata]